MSRSMTKQAKWSVYLAKTQISMGIHAVWPVSSLCAQWIAIRTQGFFMRIVLARIRLGGCPYLSEYSLGAQVILRGARWLSGRVSDSGARGPGFETYRHRVVSLSKTLYSPKVLVNYPGSDGSVPTWLKNCWLGR